MARSVFTLRVMDSARTHTSPPDDVRTTAPTGRALATEAVHAGRDDLAAQDCTPPPIDLSTTYPSYDSRGEAARIDAFATTGADPEGPPVYGRLGNPTVARFETALARLEGTEAAVAFASGMAALSAVLLARAVSMACGTSSPYGPLYGCSDHLLTAGLLGSEVTWTDPAGIADALRPDTGLVLVESPANPTLAEVDLRAVAHACGSVPLLVDNTFATPVLQRPAEQGARLVLHSATKYLGGHGDVLAGVVACDEEFAGRLRQVRFATGGVLHPLAGYLLLRGLSTLPVRVRAASANAAALVRRPRRRPARGPRPLSAHRRRRWSPSRSTAIRTRSSAASASDHPGGEPWQCRHADPAPGVHQPPHRRRRRPPGGRGERPAPAAVRRPGGRRRPVGRPGPGAGRAGGRGDPVGRRCRGPSDRRRAPPAGSSLPIRSSRGSRAAARAAGSRRGRDDEGPLLDLVVEGRPRPRIAATMPVLDARVTAYTPSQLVSAAIATSRPRSSPPMPRRCATRPRPAARPPSRPRPTCRWPSSTIRP